MTVKNRIKIMKKLIKIFNVSFVKTILILSIFSGLSLVYIFSDTPLDAKISLNQKNKVQLEGRLVSMAVDNYDAKTDKITDGGLKKYIQTNDNKLTELKPDFQVTEDSNYTFSPNQTVKVEGVIRKDKIIYQKITPVKGNKGLQKSYLQSLPLSDKIGEQKTLVALFNYADYQNKPFSLQTIQDRVMISTQSVNNFVKENSYNKAWLNPTFVDWRMLPLNFTEFKNHNQLLEEAIKVLDDEIYFPDYHRLIFVFLNGGSIMKASGLGSLARILLSSPGDGKFYASVSWISSNAAINSVIAHELGHNFGFYHASSFYADGEMRVPPYFIDFGPSASQLSMINYYEYGDSDDNMGNGYNHWSTVWKSQAGWIKPSQLVTVTQSSEYTLDQVELPSDGIKMLKIPFGEGLNGEEVDYFIEYRKPLGIFDAYSMEDSIQIRLRNWHYVYPDENIYWLYNSVRFKNDSTDYLNVDENESFFDPYRGIKIDLIEKIGDGDNSKVKIKITFSDIDLNFINIEFYNDEDYPTTNPETIFLTNNTSKPLNIGQASIGGRDASSFKIIDDELSNQIVPINGKASIKVKLAAESGEYKFGYIKIPTTDDIRPFATVTLWGIDQVQPKSPIIYSPRFTTKSSGTTNAVEFEIRWLATDAFSTITEYKLEYHTHATTSWQPYMIDEEYWTPKTTTEFSGKLGETYYFRVWAKDSAGNVSRNPSETAHTTIPFDNTSLSYSEGWKSQSLENSFMNTNKYSEKKGSSATFVFNTERLSQELTLTLISSKGPNKGIMDVYIRNKVNGIWSNYSKVKTLDLYSSMEQNKVPLVVRFIVSFIPHEIKLVATGTKNAKSSGYRVDIDGLAIQREMSDFGNNGPPGKSTMLAPTFSTNVSKTNNFKISWPETDSLLPIASYQVKYRPHTTTAWSTILVDRQKWISEKYLYFTGKSGYTYYFKVRAKDVAGNIGEWSDITYEQIDLSLGKGFTIIPYDDTSLNYSTEWKMANPKRSYKNTITYTNKSGADATFVFKTKGDPWGQLLAIIAPTGPKKGKIDVYIRDKINGVWTDYDKITPHRKPIDLYSNTYKNRITFMLDPWSYDWTWGNTNIHQLKLVATGTKNKNSGGYRVDIDGVAIQRSSH